MTETCNGTEPCEKTNPTLVKKFVIIKSLNHNFDMLKREYQALQF